MSIPLSSTHALILKCVSDFVFLFFVFVFVFVFVLFCFVLLIIIAFQLILF